MDTLRYDSNILGPLVGCVVSEPVGAGRAANPDETPVTHNDLYRPDGSPRFRATTILAVRRNGAVALAGDGQVTMGDVVVKHGARKR